MTRRMLIPLALIVIGAPSLAAAAEPAAARCEKNQAVIRRLEDMGTFLREQRTFSVRSETTTDEVLENGQKIQLAATGELEVRRPDRLHATFSSDRRDREFFYDGRTFTVYSPSDGYYATVAAPSSIFALLGQLSDRYNIELPLADLFRWGTPRSGVDQILCASFIGTSKLDGTTTDQFAFRQAGLDWQIWIEQGPRPLPRKLVLTTTDDPAKPEHTMALDWNLTPRTDPQAFIFRPPRTASRIEIVDLGG